MHTWTVSRTEVLNTLIARRGYTSYLEIGVNDPRANFDRIIAKHKDGVDPAGRCNYPMTSDEFFAKINSIRGQNYELIFIDGLHLGPQVLRDIFNARKHLLKGGTIVIHDCNPPTEESQDVDPAGKYEWWGTGWKAMAALRISDPEGDVCTIDTDCGLGIWQPDSKVVPPRFADTAWSIDIDLEKYFTWEYLQQYRKDLLNLVSWEEFKAHHLG